MKFHYVNVIDSGTIQECGKVQSLVCRVGDGGRAWGLYPVPCSFASGFTLMTSSKSNYVPKCPNFKLCNTLRLRRWKIL